MAPRSKLGPPHLHQCHSLSRWLSQLLIYLCGTEWKQAGRNMGDDLLLSGEWCAGSPRYPGLEDK